MGTACCVAQPLHVSPAAFPRHPPSLEVTDLFVPAQLFAWLCPKLSREMVGKKRKKEIIREKLNSMERSSKSTFELSSCIWLRAGPCTAGLAYPGGMLKTSPCGWEFLKLTLPAAKHRGTTANACANLHLKISFVLRPFKNQRFAFFYMK